ncbi:GtrA family protein [Chitinimonas lacunae]|uniref:GtrA family protein n=1 Tax=Chitinimonas lacunae TaxID=1963018 RepID=A0ABV8MXV1_9NEIS
MRRLKREYLSPTFVRFLFAGGIAAGVNIGSRVGYSLWLPYPVAITLAYLTGMATAFMLNRRFVFAPGEQPLSRQLLWFVLVNLAGVAQTLLISLLLARWLLPALGVIRHAEILAHLVGVLVPVFTSFLGHKYLSFRQAERRPLSSRQP